MFCHECGRRVLSYHNFCSYCGADLKEEKIKLDRVDPSGKYEDITKLERETNEENNDVGDFYAKLDEYYVELGKLKGFKDDPVLLNKQRDKLDSLFSELKELSGVDL